MNNPTKEQFLSDVKDHGMIVLKDDGLYRHIRFEKPNTNHMAFQITTWPGYLCVSGDMGCYTFSRTQDMFQFFGFNGVENGINPYYWKEKVLAGASHMGALAICEEYSQDKFISAVKECANNYRENHGFDEISLDDLAQEISDICDASNDYHEAVSAIQNSDLECLEDFWENSVTDYKYHYIWCLWAIVWGINIYYEDAKNIKSEDLQ